MIKEAAVLVVGDDQQRAAPLRTLRNRLHHAGNQRLTQLHVVAGVIIVGQKVGVDDRKRRQRTRLGIFEKLVAAHHRIQA